MLLSSPLLKIRNMEEFSLEVEKLVETLQLTYIEAVVEHLKKCDLECDNHRVKNLLSPKIQQLLYQEARELNMLGKKKKKLIKLK
jgi:hypothetical protein